jgi:predicted enzyme related to lactoylglutathione lyase
VSIKVGFTTFDCRDPRAVAEFWATALSYEIDAPNEAAGEILLEDPKGEGPSLGFMKVPEPKVVKNRVHLDLYVAEGTLEDEVERLVSAGARAIETLRDPIEGYLDPCVWTVMQDPEGNEFCVLEPLSKRARSGVSP